MVRALLILIAIVVAAWGFVWLADHPGAVELDWGGYHIETSAAFLAAALAGLALVVALIIWGLVTLLRAPRKIARAQADRARRKGYEALTRGMVAVAAGDTAGAQKQVQKAEVLLHEPPLTMLLSAQAAQLAGDEKVATKYFKAMLETKDTEFLGVRGLLSQAMKDGDHELALNLAERAHRLRPDSDWVNTSLFDLQVRAGKWGDAEGTVGGAVKHKLLDAPTSQRRQALLNYELSLKASADGQVAEAIKRARRATEQAPDFVPAAVRHAQLLLDEGKVRKVATAIEGAWGRIPRADFLPIYVEAKKAEDKLQKVRAAQKLAKSNPDHAESHLTIARAALDAELWGEARKHLTPLSQENPPARVCRLMAELEEAEHGNTELARAWLVRATMAEPDPAWICGSCGAVVADWTPTCGKCQSFDSLSWRAPAVVLPLAAMEMPTAALAAPQANGEEAADEDTAEVTPAAALEHGEASGDVSLTSPAEPVKEGSGA